MRAAQAIESALVQCNADAEVRVVDWWSLMNVDVAKSARQMYLQLVQHHPELYDRIYRLSDGTWRDVLAGTNELPAVVRELFALMHRLPVEQIEGAGAFASDRVLLDLFRSSLLAHADLSKLLLIKWGWLRLQRRMRKALEEFDPDVVVSTQMIPAALVSSVKCSRRRRMQPLSVAVPTDFGVHDFWRQPGTDLYCTPHDALTELPSSLNVKQLVPSGFPLLPEFSVPTTQAAARQILQLQPDIPVILVLGGGLGLGIEAVAEQVLKAKTQIQVLVLRGRSDLVPADNQAHSERVRYHDWTDRVDLFMAASDIVVGKFGGSTVAETLACGRPLLTTRSLPGQEGFNVRFLEKQGVGRVLDDSDLAPMIDRLLTQPAVLAQLQAQAFALGRRDGARLIADRILHEAEVRRPTPQTTGHSRGRALGRRVLTGLDGWYRRRFRLRPLGPVLLVGREPYKGRPREFADGTRLAACDAVGVLHFNNARLASLRFRSRQTLGVNFARLFRESLEMLASQAQADPELKSVAVFHGVTWFKAHGRKVGFVSEALPPGLRRWWLCGHFRLLTWGFASLPAKTAGRWEPRNFWITRGDLIKHFGAKSR